MSRARDSSNCPCALTGRERPAAAPSSWKLPARSAEGTVPSVTVPAAVTRPATPRTRSSRTDRMRVSRSNWALVCTSGARPAIRPAVPGMAVPSPVSVVRTEMDGALYTAITGPETLSAPKEGASMPFAETFPSNRAVPASYTRLPSMMARATETESCCRKRSGLSVMRRRSADHAPVSAWLICAFRLRASASAVRSSLGPSRPVERSPTRVSVSPR